MSLEPVSQAVSNVIDAARKIDMWWMVIGMLEGYPKVQKEGVVMHLEEARAELNAALAVLDGEVIKP